MSTQPEVISVEDLNRQIRQVIEGQVGAVWVQGEISNFKPHTSGHYYFSLKDSKSQISAVMFRGHNSRLKFRPKDGDEVVVRGKVTVYEPRGNYQIMCEMMEPVGAGALQKAFEQLKEKLKAEGLFEASRKRPLPHLPQHVAVVTSPTGAAIRDILNILKRRNRMIQVTVVPTVVQGASAAPQICEALEKAYKLPGVDAIICGRGGGSMEDMWCFNDENLARTIARSPVPLISAVGHEIDFTIADFVADVRAPTPSAAAELISKNVTDLSAQILNFKKMLELSIQRMLKFDQQRLRTLSAQLIDPKRKLQDLILRNDDLSNRLSQAMSFLIEKKTLQLSQARAGLISPLQLIHERRQRLEFNNQRLRQSLSQKFRQLQDLVRARMAVLDSLSPLKVVKRGYSVVRTHGKVLKEAKNVKIGDKIELLLMVGSIEASVTAVKEDNHGI
ncbi:MAG: exodeoxyribonuclease VII large subunit [Proteobacteria bacterium]|jgi:exodeoxyribonuclease VII large subunit|nr:exodeoxyribonuclease VII large subunit [Pseudomonadota bacterium]